MSYPIIVWSLLGFVKKRKEQIVTRQEFITREVAIACLMVYQKLTRVESERNIADMESRHLIRFKSSGQIQFKEV